MLGLSYFLSLAAVPTSGLIHTVFLKKQKADTHLYFVYDF